MVSAEEDPLLETRRRLAALSGENRELRAENSRLVSQCGAAAERLVRLGAERDAAENDFKHINFSLMRQLRAKLGALREQERLVAQMREKAAALEGRLRESRAAQETSAKEAAVQRERVAALEGKLQHVTERLFRAGTETARHADDLNAASSGSCEAAAKVQQENVERLGQVEEALRVSRDSEASLERVVEALRYELEIAREALEQNHSSTHGDQRRTLSARSGAFSARERVMTMCNSFYEQLRELQRQLRVMEGFVMDSNRHMERILQEKEAKLREQTEHFIAADETLVAFLCQRVTEQERELRVVREELSGAAYRLRESEKKLSDANAELQRREAELGSLATLQQEVQTLRAELQECNSREEDLRGALARLQREAEAKELQAVECRRLLNGEREQMEAARRSYEREVDGVDEQLREFTTVVSQALRRLEFTMQQHRRRRLSSPAGGVMSSVAPLTHSAEFTCDSGALSPSVLRVESSPCVLSHS